MATATKSVENLLDAVKQLAPDELAQFTSRFADWQGSSADNGRSDSLLVEQTKLGLSEVDAKRLRRFVAMSERGDLTASELQEYRQLTQRAERIQATRVQALAELARRRNQPITQVKKDVGWHEERHGG